MVSVVNSGLRVLDAMTIRPVVATPLMTLRDVASIMERRHVGSVLIMNGRELLGIVTESDYVRRAILEGYDPIKTPVSRIMTKDLVTVSPGLDLFDALMLMKDADIRHLPVVDEGKLVGFVTIKDILSVQPHLMENIVDKVDVREKHRKPIGRYMPELDEE